MARPAPPGSARKNGERRSTRFGPATAAVLALLVVCAAIAVIVIEVNDNRDTAARHKREAAAATARQQREAAAAAQARTRAAAEAHARQLAVASELARRARLATSLEAAITKEGREKAAQETMTGIITKTKCAPVSGQSPSDLSRSTVTYSCFAVDEVSANGNEGGYSYTATINFATGAYTWHKEG